MFNLDGRLAGVATALDSQEVSARSITKSAALLVNEEARQNHRPCPVQADYTNKPHGVSSAESMRTLRTLTTSGTRSTQNCVQRTGHENPVMKILIHKRARFHPRTTLRARRH